ncbi:MAG: VOC family protein [Myxococcales bacterium]|nr:VOC family protein [Myxococcales bacterium]
MSSSGRPTTAASVAIPGVVFDHIAFGVPSIDATPAFIAGRLGGRPYARGPGIGFVWKQWRFAEGGVLEVLEPSGPPGGFLHRFLDRRGPGIHHVTFKVPDIRAAMERAQARRYDVVGYDDSFPGWKECFLHPKQAQGIVVQLAESDPAFDDGAEIVTSFGPGDVDPGPAVKVIGLRVTARSARAARLQWGELLGGSCAEANGALHFHWPDSPMRIAVVPDPEREEGPLCVEVTSDHPLDLLPGPEPLLGAEFRVVSDDSLDRSSRRREGRRRGRNTA